MQLSRKNIKFSSFFLSFPVETVLIREISFGSCEEPRTGTCDLNQSIVSIVFAIILVLGINKITDVIFYVEKPEKSAYQVATVTTVEETLSNESSSTSSESGNIMAVFASTTAAEGAKVFKKCAACHSINEGGSNKIGPALWGVLGRPAGSVPDYKYSKALSTYGKTWDVAELNGFLLNPKKWIPNNKMGFGGLKKPEDRAAIILYMNEFSDNPLSLK